MVLVELNSIFFTGEDLVSKSPDEPALPVTCDKFPSLVLVPLGLLSAL